ncbi:hypothetical protein V6N13_142490 [Hibiscus sabdariffa]
MFNDLWDRLLESHSLHLRAGNQAVENENEADPALGNQWLGIVKGIQMIVFSFIGLPQHRIGHTLQNQ